MLLRAPSLESVGITRPRYRAVDCDSIRPSLAIPDFVDAPFSPAWSPLEAGPATFFETDPVANRWAAKARNRVVVAGGLIHLVSSAD